jgi:hypothetical protein
MMNLKDIASLAHECLSKNNKVELGDYKYLTDVKIDKNIEQACRLDFRIKIKEFDKTHLTILVQNIANSQIVGNMTIFLLGCMQLKNISLWKERREGQEEIRYLNKTTLNDILFGYYTDNVIMHGYIESPRYKTKQYYSPEYNALTMRYVKFLGKLNQLGICNEVPMFIEATGQYQINSTQRDLARLDLSDINQNRENQIGRTHQNSIASEKFAKFIGLSEIEGVYNLRTLGRVYFSSPIVCT